MVALDSVTWYGKYHFKQHFQDETLSRRFALGTKNQSHRSPTAGRIAGTQTMHALPCTYVVRCASHFRLLALP